MNLEEVEPELSSESNPDEKFAESGGEVFSRYPDGRPARWKCGIGENEEIIDPTGMAKEAIHYLNEKGEWEAGNPDEELIKEIKRWHTDWMDVR